MYLNYITCQTYETLTVYFNEFSCCFLWMGLIWYGMLSSIHQVFSISLFFFFILHQPPKPPPHPIKLFSKQGTNKFNDRFRICWLQIAFEGGLCGVARELGFLDYDQICLLTLRYYTPVMMPSALYIYINVVFTYITNLCIWNFIYILTLSLLPCLDTTIGIRKCKQTVQTR